MYTGTLYFVYTGVIAPSVVKLSAHNLLLHKRWLFDVLNDKVGHSCDQVSMLRAITFGYLPFQTITTCYTHVQTSEDILRNSR